MTEEEVKKLGGDVVEGQVMIPNNKDTSAEVKLSDVVVDLVIAELKARDSKNQLTDALVDLYEKFVEKPSGKANTKS